MLVKMWKQSLRYMGKHPWFNMWTHIIAGLGIGIVLARPLATDHPVRWGIGLLLISGAMHLYAMMER